jgi:hypothetical protein
MPEVLGVDVGGVILDFVRHRGTGVSFDGDNYLRTPVIADAIESLAELNAGRFKDRVYLVSRYPAEKGPERVQEWLRHVDFYGRTGIPESHLYQCAERHEKTPICKDLGVTHFVDDRAEVLAHMIESVPHLYLFQALDEDKEVARQYPQIRLFETWKELLEVVR